MGMMPLAAARPRKCRDCGRPTNPKRREARCRACVHKLTCNICGHAKPDQVRSGWCSACRRRYVRWCAIMNVLGGRRPDQATLEENVAVYQRRAQLGEPLFQKERN